MIALYLTFGALWGGLWWRLRGGALTALTGFDPGTGGMRAIAAVGLSAPLLAVSAIAFLFDLGPTLVAYWHYAALIPVLWVTWAMAGWGAFQGMGHETETTNPLADILISLRLRRKIMIDLAGMAIEGLFCTTLIIGVFDLLTGHWSPLGMTGLLFAPCYLVPQRLLKFPSIPPFAAAGSEWGEVLVGALVGLSVAAEVLL